MFGKPLTHRWILITGLLLTGLILAGCEEEVSEDTTSLGSAQATVNVAGTITDAGYVSGDFVIIIKDSTGSIMGDGIVTGAASATFSIAVAESSGDVIVTAYNDINGDTVFDVVTERFGATATTVSTADVTGLTLTLALQVKVSGTINFGAYATGTYQIVANVSGTPVAVATSAGGASVPYSIFVPENTTIDFFVFNDNNTNDIFDGKLAEAYVNATVNVIAVPLTYNPTLLEDIELSGTVSQPGFTSGDLVLFLYNGSGTQLDTLSLSGGTSVSYQFAIRPNPGNVNLIAFNDLNGDEIFNSGIESSVSGVNNVLGGDVLGYDLFLPELGATADYAFDAGTLAGWTVAGTSGTVAWHVSTVRSSSGSFSIHYANPGTGLYDDGLINSGTLTSPSELLSASPFLTFDYFLANECVGTNNWCFYDVLSVEISTDGGTTWTLLNGRLATTGGVFYTHSVDLGAYASTTVKVRFLFNTGDAGLNTYEGAYVDNVTFQ